MHNATAYLASDLPLTKQILESNMYTGSVLFGGTLLAIAILYWFHSLRCGRASGGAPAAPLDALT